MAMMWLAITTWLVFVFASAWGYKYYKRKALEGINRTYVNVVDDTFKSINMTLGRIERGYDDVAKNQIQLTALFVGLTNALLALGQQFPPEQKTTPLTPKEMNSKSFIMGLEYVRDKFAASPIQKKVVEDIIGNIKKHYARKDDRASAS